MAIWKIMTVDGPRLASGRVDDGPKTMLPAELSIDDLLAGRSEFTFAQASVAADGDPVPADARLLAPLGTQEVWAAGVTYLRSRAARMEESTAPDHYDRVYMSDRPELFFKAAAWRVRASGESVGIRDDSTWNVPEPELAVVANAQGEVVAYTIGNDMSSRSIEGDNPLYLPQAKVYRHSTALGPCLVGVEEAPPEDRLVVRLTINRAGEELFDESIAVTEMKRTPDELVGWLYRGLDFPAGAVLLTGTGIVPDSRFTLRHGDDVRIRITGLGELQNTVQTVATAAASE